jgi:hypothetical protein
VRCSAVWCGVVRIGAEWCGVVRNGAGGEEWCVGAEAACSGVR